MENSSSVSSECVSSGTGHHNLDNLPDLVYYHLFKYLDLDDVLELRLINKKFYSIVKDSSIYELSFLSEEGFGHSHKNNWFSTTKSIRYRNQLDASKLPLLFNPSNNLLNLKYLRIIQNHSASIKMKDLNKFTKLQILMVDVGIGLNDLLQLPDLKALSIILSNCQYVSGYLLIDTPNLHSLSIAYYYNGANTIEFKNPLSIKYLEFSNFTDDISIIFPFKNLECLDIYGDFYNLIPKIDDLLVLNNLKKLKIDFTGLLSSSKLNELKNVFKSKKNGLEIIFKGVKIKEINKFDEYEEDDNYHYDNDDDLKFQLNNYGELDDLNGRWRLLYSQLIDLLPNKQPSDLFSKLNNIQLMKINSSIKDENRLIHCIKECPNLTELEITGSLLSQQFYDQLPAASLLSALNIEEHNINLSYEFVMKMPYLRSFLTSQDVLLDENLNLNYLKYLKNFRFETECKIVSISKKSKDRYTVHKDSDKVLSDQKYFSFNEIIHWLDDLRNEKNL